MPYPDAQPGKLTAAEVLDQVAQSVVPRVPSSGFEADFPRWQFQLVVCDQNLFYGNLVKSRHPGNRKARYIHESCRYE
jgi:hypothetical protein